MGFFFLHVLGDLMNPKVDCTLKPTFSLRPPTSTANTQEALLFNCAQIACKSEVYQ